MEDVDTAFELNGRRYTIDEWEGEYRSALDASEYHITSRSYGLSFFFAFFNFVNSGA